LTAGAPPHGQAEDQTGSFIQVSAGYDHTCAVGVAARPSAGVESDGYRCIAQLRAIHCAARRHLHAGQRRAEPHLRIKTDGGIVCWGGNTWGQSTPPPGVFKQVAAGYLHTCAIRVDDTLTCWGYNLYGV